MSAQTLPCFDQRHASERLLRTARIVVCPSPSAFFALCLLFPCGRSVTRRSIGQTLANDAFQCALGALHIIYAKPDPIGIAEIELRKITVQMLLAAMLVHTQHAALENRVIPFKG